MGNTTTKADLVNVIANRTGLTKNETETVVDSLFESIIDSLKAGNGLKSGDSDHSTSATRTFARHATREPEKK